MELTLFRSELEMVPVAIRECFSSDPELLSKWHIAAPATLDACVDRTLRDLKDVHKSFKFYMVFVDEDLAGYWGTENDNYINLIFVKPQFRHKEFMSEFWDLICETMTSIFTTAVYSKNRPAMSFYSKLGRKLAEIDHNGHPVTRFVFYKKVSNLCQ